MARNDHALLAGMPAHSARFARNMMFADQGLRDGGGVESARRRISEAWQRQTLPEAILP